MASCRTLVYAARPPVTTSKPIFVTSDEGLAVLRHSTAHVLAQAVQELFPDAKLGIGPPVKDGFYYDFAVSRTLHT
jgi:threonyl-tRNA synthetase